jgi:hypothetical protein
VVLGDVQHYGNEQAYRVRVEDTGVEVTLVREPGNSWYTDERLDALAAGVLTHDVRPPLNGSRSSPLPRRRTH